MDQRPASTHEGNSAALATKQPDAAQLPADVDLIAAAFDAEFYRRETGVAIANPSELLQHYVTEGWLAGKNPAPHFSVERYLDHYPDVAASGGEPLYHYLKWGRDEGRQAFAVETQPQSEDQRLAAPYFDARFYLRTNPDVATARTDPLTHYLAQGWKEGRDPSPDFSTDYYLRSNPDVQDAGLNPLLHYAQSGRAEGRQPKHLGGWQADVLRHTVSPQEKAVSWKKRPPARLLDAASLEATLTATLARARPAGTVVALGHDRYYDNTGGIQACVQEEQQLLNARGMAYLFINPYQPLPLLSGEDVSCWLADVSLDGRLLGTLAGEDLLEVLARTLGASPAHLCVHSLLGHNPAWCQQFAARVPLASRYFWTHDYFTLCPGYTLLRNDVSFCGAPPVESNSCQLCVYGDERARHLARLDNLFRAVPFTMLSPSQSALDLWAARTTLPYQGSRVIEHRSLQDTGRARPNPPARSRVRVAFLGHAAPHKGWFSFKDLVAALRHDDRYEFYHLGVAPDPSVAATHVPVRFSAQTPDAMQAAVESHAIDIALVLSNWPETFCLTAYEARAGGASIYAWEGSGNLAAMVRRDAAGQVFAAYPALLEHFRDGGAARHAQARRKQGVALGKLASSGVSTSAIAPPVAQPRGAAHAKP